MDRFPLFLTASLTASLWTIPAHAATTCVPTPFAPCPSDSFAITDANGTVLTDANGKLASVTFTEDGGSAGEGKYSSIS